MPAQRVAIVGKLKPGSVERAEQVVAEGPPFELDEAGLEQHSVFLCPDYVLFVFEGPDAENAVRVLVDDPVVSARFGVWGPLLDGTPQLAHERFFWTPAPAGSS